MNSRQEIGDIDSNDVHTELVYLARDEKYGDEKPYEMRYDAGDDFPRTNMIDDVRTATIQDFRPLRNPKNFEEYGFSIAEVDCDLKAPEFADDQKVEGKYYPAVLKLLKQMFPDATEIRVLEHMTRERDARFHRKSKESFATTQPATGVHIGELPQRVRPLLSANWRYDFSPYSAARTAWAFDIDPAQFTRVLTVNVWKSFQGHGNDWPLALCDWRTMDHGSEGVAADVVFRNRFTENVRFHYSAAHAWYYVKDLKDSEVIVFRQTDSGLHNGGGVAHASFNNPKADQDAPPRASIELRAYIFFK